MGSKGLYGILAMAELVEGYRAQHPIQVKDIAHRQKIPEEYLSQIMVLLKRANLVHGTRGPGGGYRLARAPETITVGEVMRCLEGHPLALGIKNPKHPSTLSPVLRRLTATWEKAMEAAGKILDETSLADLCKPQDGTQMYYI
ncbi:MAG TPA: Rrf2 family transcriptional regulator [Candidatus Binatia bacterium]